MTRPILFLTMLALASSAYGQKLYPLRETIDSIGFQLSVQNGQLTLFASTEGSFFEKRKDFPTLQALRIEGADLVLEYAPRNSGDALSYSVNFYVKSTDGTQIIPAWHEKSNTESVNGLRRLAWMDIAEFLPDLNERLTLFVQRTLMGAVNCEGPRPVFSLKKQLPHYAAAGAGLVLLGLGQVYRDQRDDLYADYQLRWSDGFPAPDSGNNPLTKATTKDRNAKICTYVGLGLLGIDAWLFTHRSLKFKRKQKVYDKFCGEKASLSLRPQLLPGAGIGFALQGNW